MKTFAQLTLIVAVSLSVLPVVRAQDVPSPLARVAKALECSRQESTSGWKVERGKPIAGSENVLIEMYVSAGRRVKVSIIYNRSESEAIVTMKRGAAGNSAKAIQDLGDEAYSWGYSDAIAFRKGNLTVYVSAISDIDSLLPALDDSERTNLRRIEEIAINKSLARIVASILSNLDKACQTMERV